MATKAKEAKMASVTTLRPKQMLSLVAACIKARAPIMITGAPGTGKSDLVAQAAEASGAEMILSHPVVSDPTDAKGLPWRVSDTEAAFLPFGDLALAMRATKPTVWFLDDLGQAPPAVQASFMQLLLARRVNGHKLPECVTFVAATNRRTDRAGVSGILEPVKSRFTTIVELAPTLDDWMEWALSHSIAPEVVAFLRFRTDLLFDFQPTNDLTNSPCPRTWAGVSKLVTMDLPRDVEYPAVAGEVGEGAASEFVAFLKVYRDLPDLDGIILDPKRAPIPPRENPSALYAVSAGLASRATKETFPKIAIYAERMREAGHAEFGVLLLRDSVHRCPEITRTGAFIKLAESEFGKLVLPQ